MKNSIERTGGDIGSGRSGGFSIFEQEMLSPGILIIIFFYSYFNRIIVVEKHCLTNKVLGKVQFFKSHLW